MSEQVVVGYAPASCFGGSQGQDCSLNGVCNGGWFLQEDCSDSETYWCCCIPSNGSLSGNTCPPGNQNNFCPNLGGISSINAYLPDPNGCSGDTNCRTACVYPVDQFKTPAQVSAFFQAFQSDPASLQSAYTFLMPEYCVQQVSTCPTDPVTGTAPKTCSRMVSTDTNDQFCQQWVGMTGYAPIIQGTMNSYCTSVIGPTGTGPYGSTEPSECMCVGRAYSPLYQGMQFGQGFADACWWKPCQQPALYLVPPELYIQPGTCPTSICSQAIEAFNDNNISIDFPNSNFYISCNFGGNTGSTGGTGGTGGNGSSFLNDLFEFVRQYEAWVILVIVIIVVLIVIMVIAVLRK